MSRRHATRSQPESLERPHVGWWIVVLAGASVYLLLAFDAGAYATWCTTVTPFVTQTQLRGFLLFAAVGHVAEAFYAVHLAQRLGLQEAAPGLFLQTLMVGYPSLRLLLRRVGRSR